MTAQKTEYKRYELWFAELSNGSSGSVQKGKRPVLIIQNDMGNKYSPTVQVASVTTAKKKAMPTNVNLNATECGLKNDSIAMMEQVSTISKDQLKWKIGSVPEEYVAMLDKAGMVQFGYVSAWD